MDKKLVEDTLAKLDKHLNPAAQINLQPEDEELTDMVHLLMDSKLKRKRKIALLGSYILLYTALRRHRLMDAREESATLNRELLDGDYLFGAYIRWLVEAEDSELLSFLTPVHKRIQIQFAEGLSLQDATTQLLGEYRHYLTHY